MWKTKTQELSVVAGLRSNWLAGDGFNSLSTGYSKGKKVGLYLNRSNAYYLGIQYQAKLKRYKLLLGYGMYIYNLPSSVTVTEIQDPLTMECLDEVRKEGKNIVHTFNIGIIPKWGSKKREKEKKKLEKKLQFFN